MTIITQITQLCKGGCDKPAKYKGWCGIKWSSGKKYGVSCQVVEKKRGDSISKYRIREAKLGLNPMQDPKICKKNHSIERNKKSSKTLKKLGELGLLPQQTESKKLRKRRLKRIRKALRKLANEKRLPQQIESEEKRKERYRKISETVSKAIAEGRLKLCLRGKKIKYKSKCSGNLILRSKWEKLVAKLLDSLNLNWKYEPFSVSYWDSERKMKANTIPDFYLPSKNIIIEVKGYEFHPKRTIDKVKALKKKGYKVILIREKEIYFIERNRIDFLINYIKSK